MLLSSLLFSITLSTAPTANIPGVLDDINIGDVPKIWVDTSNDDIGPPIIRPQKDDNRTYEFSLGYKLPHNLIFLADDSALTERYTTKTRIDQLTFALGYIIQKNDFIITPTIGTRLNGNYGGDTVQSDFHSLVEPKQAQVDGVYERAPNVLLAGLSMEYDKELYRGLYDDAAISYGYMVRCVGLITTSGETQCAIQGLLYSEHIDWYSYYCGLRLEGRGGNSGSITAKEVQTVEKGVYGILGTTILNRVYAEWGCGLGNCRFAYGSVGIFNRF